MWSEVWRCVVEFLRWFWAFVLRFIGGVGLLTKASKAVASGIGILVGVLAWYSLATLFKEEKTLTFTTSMGAWVSIAALAGWFVACVGWSAYRFRCRPRLIVDVQNPDGELLEDGVRCYRVKVKNIGRLPVSNTSLDTVASEPGIYHFTGKLSPTDEALGLLIHLQPNAEATFNLFFHKRYDRQIHWKKLGGNAKSDDRPYHVTLVAYGDGIDPVTAEFEIVPNLGSFRFGLADLAAINREPGFLTGKKTKTN
jgi:hypothetical protein